MMESKIRKHEVKMPPSMMSNALVNVANLGTIIEGSVCPVLRVSISCRFPPRRMMSVYFDEPMLSDVFDCFHLGDLFYFLLAV